MKTIYGPVASWRLGKSLGLDLICSPEKICSFNCTYCQLEKTKKITKKRQNFVKTQQIKKELTESLKETKPDVITLSGTGEPTLAKNIDETIEVIRNISDLPIAILTNSTLLYDKDVQEALKKIDIIIAKLDAPNAHVFKLINQPAKDVRFDETIDGIKQMRKQFKGKFATQSMFIDKNKKFAEEIAIITKEIDPDEVQINTPLRPCREKPLTVKELDKIEQKFTGLNTINVYHSNRPMTNPLDKMELFKRRRMDR